MRACVFIFFSILVWFSFADSKAYNSQVNDDQLTDGGISIHITNAFLKTVKNQVIDSLIQAFKPDHTWFGNTTDLQLFKLHYNISDITMFKFEMDYEASTIEFRPEEPHIFIQFIDYTMDLKFNYSVKADPEFYRDEGPGQVQFAYQNITLGLDLIRNDDGIFQLKTSDIKANFTNGATFFGGEGDLSYMLNVGASLLRSQMNQSASATIEQMVNQALPIINGQLAAGGCVTNTSGLLIDFCAMGDPKFNEDSMSLIMKGEVRYSNASIPFQDQRLIPYVHDLTDRDIQAWVSDYFLNTTIYSAFNLGLLDVEIKELSENVTITAETFKLLWPNIVKVMDPKQAIVIRVVANKAIIPHFQIVNGVSMAKGLVDISFATAATASKPKEVFLEMTSNLNVTVDLEIQSPFKLMTNIKQLKIKAQKLSIDKYGLTNLEDMNSIIGTISGFIRNYLNRILSGYRYQEIDLSIFKVDLNNTVLYEKNRYIYLDSQPQFHHDAKLDAIRGPVEWMEQKPVTYQDQVDALANVLKLTPLFQSLQDLKKHEQMYKNLAFIGGLPHAYNQGVEEPSLPKEREFENEEIM